MEKYFLEERPGFVLDFYIFALKSISAVYRACYFLPHQSCTPLKLGVAIMLYHIARVSLNKERQISLAMSVFFGKRKPNTPQENFLGLAQGRKFSLNALILILVSHKPVSYKNSVSLYPRLFCKPE